MADKKWRLGYGDESAIVSALEAGKLDGADLIVTKDTKRIAFVKPSDKSILFVKSKLETFDSIESANEYLTTDKSVYVGELISVLVDDKYRTYRVQELESSFVLEDIETESKEYVQVVDVLPEENQEEGIIYICGTTGSIWTGSEWKVVFEDVASTEDRLKNYVDELISGITSFSPSVVDADHELPSEDYKSGQSWRVASDGEYAGQKCEVGDLIICVNDYVEGLGSDNDFIILQTNIDGAAIGAESSEDGEIVLFSGVSGKTLKGSGINIEKLTDVIEKSHEHENKEILDTYTLTQDELFEDIHAELYQVEPYVYHSNFLIANGYPITVEKVDDSTNKATYFVSGEKREIEFKAGLNTAIIGGTLNMNCHSSSIVINSGTIGVVHGGSYADGDVGDATIVINGGQFTAVYGGGMPLTDVSDHANHVGHARIIINNTDGKFDVFGGGYSYASVGTAEIEINGGSLKYVTAGGANGAVGNGGITVHGGSIDVIQSVNRGLVGSSNIVVDGGDVVTLYAGVEPDDGDVMTTATGTFGHATIELTGGSVQKLATGANNSVKDFDPTGFVSGKYCEGVLENESQATALGLVKTSKSDIDHTDVEQAKQDAIAESKAYVEAALTLTEF